jgi:hypothetical protein
MLYNIGPIGALTGPRKISFFSKSSPTVVLFFVGFVP